MNKSELVSSIQQIRDLAEKCLAGLRDSTGPPKIIKGQTSAPRASRQMGVDFDKPMRPFIMKYAKGMSGAKKFTLLLSWLAKGDLKKEVALSEIRKSWNTMKSKDLLGIGFNRVFPDRAKNKDWVDSKKKGFYHLRPDWKDIFESSND